MWFRFPFAGRNQRREQSWSTSASPGVMMEALGDRLLPSVAAPSVPPPPAAIAPPVGASATLTRKHELQVDGTFSVTGAHGNRLSATVDATLSLDGGAPRHFT